MLRAYRHGMISLPSAKRSTSRRDVPDREAISAEGVVRGNALGQFQERFKPFELAAAKLGHLRPAVGAADGGTDGDSQNVTKRM